MLKYRLIGDNDYIFDPVGTIFNNRGIEDTDKFLELDKSVTHHYSLLKNIKAAVSCFIENVNNKSEMLIVVDPDVDGFSSASIIYQYIKLLDEKANLKWIVHNDKSHGIDKIEIPKTTNLLILPDSGSGDFKRHKELKGKGIDIIVLDHHEVKKESEDAIIVNPQIGGYPNLNFSGAGVVIKFCEALDDRLKLDYSSQFYDLVALGNIADSMIMTELETRYYVQQGLKDISNDFFNALLRKQEYSTGGKTNVTSISFYIAPLINATIRVSNLSEKIDMFKAFIGEKELIKYKPRGSDEMLVPLVDDVARRCANARAKQNRIRDKIVNEIDEYIQENSLDKNKVILVDNVSIEEKNLTGLICNMIAAKYKRPAIIVSKIDEKGYGTGSARGYDKGGISDFKDVVLKSKLFEFAEGHQGAFGIKLHKDCFSELNNFLNDYFKDFSFEDEYTVDFEVKANHLKGEFVELIDELEDQWGKGFEEPYILVKDIPVDEADISLVGKKQDTISIFYNGIKYMLFKSSEECFNKLLDAKSISVIGKAKLNTYNDVTTPQILISAFDFTY